MAAVSCESVAAASACKTCAASCCWTVRERSASTDALTASLADSAAALLDAADDCSVSTEDARLAATLELTPATLAESADRSAAIEPTPEEMPAVCSCKALIARASAA